MLILLSVKALNESNIGNEKIGCQFEFISFTAVPVASPQSEASRTHVTVVTVPLPLPLDFFRLPLSRNSHLMGEDSARDGGALGVQWGRISIFVKEGLSVLTFSSYARARSYQQPMPESLFCPAL